ncbi:MAG: tetratricopeptide repeat protein [Flavobacteriales bacterium]|nr:tetratricopeptide repeat protein [Flavobacteriales bacterium]
MSTELLQKKPVLILLALLLFGVVFLAYSNHFENSFQFDDAHTIEQNNAIRNLDVVRFFTDGRTFSALPLNQSYRPLTTLENAIDYAITGTLNPKPFHIHIFLSFLFIGLLIFFFTKQLLDKLSYSSTNTFYSVLVTAFFTLLCANAETVNYIIQRAEITSGIFVLLGLIFYIKQGVFKRFYLYLLFPFIGFFSKEMAFVFAPLLFLYNLIFEEQVDLLHCYRKTEFIKCWKAFKKTLPAILFTAAFLVFYAKMLPPTFTSGGLNRYEYLITQPWVMCHYMLTYFYPYNLSADTDWTTFSSLTDYRAILGIVIVLGLIWLALKASANEKTRLFAFGMLWFFISLLPTSSVVPFSEVLNDHRSFIPYIGLTIAVIFGGRFVLDKVVTLSGGRIVLGILILGFLGANAYGIHERNKVWRTDESLWKDVTIKSPKNGRGMMNYGLALMSRGDYTHAENYFNKAAELTPTYSYIYINLGILKNAIGDKAAAEQNFRYAIQLENTQHNCWYYFGEFLFNEQRYAEAAQCFEKVQEISPGFINSEVYLLQAYHQLNNWPALQAWSEQLLVRNPQNQLAKQYLDIATNRKSVFAAQEEAIAMDPSAEKYLDLSLSYYQQTNYEKCIWAAQKALELKPDYALAYNNIGIAYYELADYHQAIDAYQKALTIQPDFELAQNNLKNAEEQKSVFENLSTDPERSDYYLNLSLQYYNRSLYQKCIEAAEKSNEFHPNANAYNNMCTAYNQLREYEKAIEACNKALELDAAHQLAQGNLNFALQQVKK